MDNYYKEYNSILKKIELETKNTSNIVPNTSWTQK